LGIIKPNLKIICECSGCGKIIERLGKYLKDKHRCSCMSIDGLEKRCAICKNWKTLDKYTNNKKEKSGVSRICKVCWKLKKYSKTQPEKRKNRLKLCLENNDMSYYINMRLKHIKGNSKKKNIVVDIDESYLLDLWNSQQGKCYYSNLPMKDEIKLEGHAAWDAPSVDRLEPTKGYVIGNVVWCLNSINSFKSNLDEASFKKLVKSINWWR
jgi:hypothetical protein